MIRLLACILLLPATALAAPASITITGPLAPRVTVTGTNPPAITVTRPTSEAVSVITPGQQGIPGPAGPGVPAGGNIGQVLTKSGAGDYATAWGDGGTGGGIWGTIGGDIADQADLQTALNGREPAGASSAAVSGHEGSHNHPASTTGLPEGINLYHTTDRAAAAAPVQSVAGRTGAVTLSTADVSGYVAPVNPDWLASGGLAQILNKPVFLRGYDGREIELQTTATHIQWRYITDPPSAWTDLAPLSALTGADGDSYGCYVTGGVTAIIYDKNGSNPAPTMQPFGVEMRVNGSIVTPATWSWSVPAGSLLFGSASGSTFTPTVSGTFSVGTADNRIDVTVTYGAITCKASAPVAVTRVGADGQAADAQNKQEIYTLIGAATTGDVLNTECGPGDAASFAGRTVRATGGDIHRTDLCGGQTWIHARPSDAATAAKFGIKASGGTPVLQFNADGSMSGTLVIR